MALNSYDESKFSFEKSKNKLTNHRNNFGVCNVNDNTNLCQSSSSNINLINNNLKNVNNYISNNDISRDPRMLLNSLYNKNLGELPDFVSPYTAIYPVKFKEIKPQTYQSISDDGINPTYKDLNLLNNNGKQLTIYDKKYQFATENVIPKTECLENKSCELVNIHSFKKITLTLVLMQMIVIIIIIVHQIMMKIMTI